VLLVLEVPRTNDKSSLAAEQMFASLHGILRSRRELAAQGGLQEHISFEVTAINKQIRFYVRVPRHLQNFVEGQIYAQYPTVQISEAEEDYANRTFEQPVQYTSELTLINNDALPIKTFPTFEVDPLAAITATLAKLEELKEEMWIQVLARPTSDDWHRRSGRYINRLKQGGGNTAEFSNMGGSVLRLLEAFWKPPEPGAGGKSPEISERDKVRITEAEKKRTKLGYQVKIRLAYLGSSESTAKLRMQAIVGTFKQFNSTSLNGFQQKSASFSHEALAQYRARFFIDRGYMLNIEELASLFHLPHTNVETPNILWASSKTAEPPSKLPAITGGPDDNEISAFGLTNFRGIHQQFGLHRSDRGRHVYIIGQTGTGKSGLLELFALSDVYHNQGYAIIDPHGDFAVNNMRFIPPSRIKDIVYFNPADTAFPMGFNPMEVINPSMKSNISSEIIGVMKRMFGESWGPRLEYILRYTILALLDYPGTTMLDITRMLTDKKFRKEVLTHVHDNIVLNFWNTEFASWTDKFAAEAISPVLNKVGAFTANPIIRNIIGQPQSTFNIRQLMDDGKILIVNLSKGLIGEDNASILGAFLVIKIQLAAMSRSDIPRVEDRRSFYLYVDEFQNFATDSFATILSEARKYGLNLTVANQYVAQMQETVRDAVFGNVGTTISFRVSPDDSPILAKPFAPLFTPEDLLQMHNRHFIISMVIRGEKAPAFTATTLTIPPVQADYSADIIANSRHVYARPRAEVEDAVQKSIAPVMPAAPQQPRPQSFQPNYNQQPKRTPEGQAMRPPQPSQPQQFSNSSPKPNAVPTPKPLPSVHIEAPKPPSVPFPAPAPTPAPQQHIAMQPQPHYQQAPSQGAGGQQGANQNQNQRRRNRRRNRPNNPNQQQQPSAPQQPRPNPPQSGGFDTEIRLR
jgi:hypothetical protein